MTSHPHRHDPDAMVTRPSLRSLDRTHRRPAARVQPTAPAADLQTPYDLPTSGRGFWGSLTHAEREAFARDGEPVGLPVGHVLWREGDAADHVLIIRSGWVKICVRRKGWERIIAVRGPGDLIGERAAMQVRRRSATVVALDTVHALRVSTGAFAAILAEHPRILRVIEEQMYDRLAEQTAPAAHVTDSPWPAAVPRDAGASAPVTAPVADIRAGQNCTILFTDIVGFSGAHRTDEDRLVVRRVMYDLLRGALEHSDVPWEPCHREDRGDGALVIVPAEIPTRRVVDPMLARLTAGLRRHNRTAGEATRFQLRVALHVGPVVPDDQGVSGLAIIQTARLLDAPVLREWLDRTQADVGFIASAYVYEFVIAHAPGPVNPASYQRVTCKVKDAELTGWMHLSSATIPPAA
ncbi:cyclic nucleotide-binding domain-containing protein [Actinomadura sp. NBRC 104425]|uniref:cyclic nucleotide-binding domain-containing protein n=1 Tax=Actinomadura sp. NBRC 104425 TaxID=3032204 RepID=UPI0025547ECD|nr:cyclic nucleotide-binding domain-containing protein [Actinomadura sp. NBRC 104425]